MNRTQNRDCSRRGYLLIPKRKEPHICPQQRRFGVCPSRKQSELFLVTLDSPTFITQTLPCQAERTHRISMAISFRFECAGRQGPSSGCIKLLTGHGVQSGGDAEPVIAGSEAENSPVHQVHVHRNAVWRAEVGLFVSAEQKNRTTKC